MATVDELLDDLLSSSDDEVVIYVAPADLLLRVLSLGLRVDKLTPSL